MSVILAIKDKNSYVLGCDSQSTNGDMKIYNQSTEYHKLQKYKDITFGSVGRCSAGKLVFTLMPVIDQMKQFNQTSIVKQFLPVLYKTLLENELAEIEEDGISFENDFIIAKGSRCYVITSSTVYPVGEFGAIGSGKGTVLPFLMRRRKSDSPEEVIRRAIHACEESHIYVSGKVFVTSTDRKDIWEV